MAASSPALGEAPCLFVHLFIVCLFVFFLGGGGDEGLGWLVGWLVGVGQGVWVGEEG
jgi:hypothetical protein